MKAKKKNTNLKRKRKSPLTIDARVAAAKTPEEKRCLNMYEQPHTPTRIQILAAEWQGVNYLRAHPELRPQGKMQMTDGKGSVLSEWDPNAARWEHAMKSASDFIRDAMLHWDADALVALAKEMKRLAAEPVEFNLDRRRRALLACGVSPRKAARAIVEMEQARARAGKGIVRDNRFENELRRLKAIRARQQKPPGDV